MKLRHKSAIVVFALALLLAVALVVGSTSLIRQYTIAGSTQYAQTVAEMVRSALTESMLNGTTATVARLKARLAETSGLVGINVARSPANIDQFGDGSAGPPHLDQISQDVM